LNCGRCSGALCPRQLTAFEQNPKPLPVKSSRPNANAVRRALLLWFRRCARPLPWRQNKDAYAVWVSEIMLQQTQVDTVVPYFLRFLRVFPNVERLAQAPLERVLELWSGLGYYRRARNLHRAAQRVIQDFDSVFPASYQEARSLPGVGDYTARAVLSIAYNQPYVVVDGNVARVVSRLRTLRGNLHQQKFRRAVTEELEQILSRTRPGHFNQAVMELGQSLCLPRAPKCPLCPLRKMCQAHGDGVPEAYPEPRPRRASETRYLATVVLHRPQGSGRRPAGRRQAATPVPEVALARGLDEGLMDGLWNFPAAFGTSPAEAVSRLQARLRGMSDGNIRWKGRSSPRSLAQLRHGITYRSIVVDIYAAEVSVNIARDSLRWFTLSRLSRSAVSSLARKIAETIVGVRSPTLPVS
jgi:A/G-specific adenine glycosylase